MASNEFIVFQRFNDKGSLLELVALMKKHQIPYVIEDASINMPFYNDELTKEFLVKIKKEDFPKVESLQKGVAISELDAVDKDYFLFNFSDEELLDVVRKPDEWGQFNFLLASKILKEKGIEINQTEIESLKQERLTELSQPDKSQPFWIVGGYISALLGGILGLVIGWSIWTTKKALPNGDKVYVYSEADRKHGKRIVILASIFLVFWLIVRLKLAR